MLCQCLRFGLGKLKGGIVPEESIKASPSSRKSTSYGQSRHLCTRLHITKLAQNLIRRLWKDLSPSRKPRTAVYIQNTPRTSRSKPWRWIPEIRSGYPPLRNLLQSVDRKRGHIKERQKSSKVSRQLSTCFDHFSRRAKDDTFQQFSRGTNFRTPFGGALVQEKLRNILETSAWSERRLCKNIGRY